MAYFFLPFLIITIACVLIYKYLHLLVLSCLLFFFLLVLLKIWLTKHNTFFFFFFLSYVKCIFYFCLSQNPFFQFLMHLFLCPHPLPQITFYSLILSTPNPTPVPCLPLPNAPPTVPAVIFLDYPSLSTML